MRSASNTYLPSTAPITPVATANTAANAGNPPMRSAMPIAIGAVTDIGMLFLRCFDGISHHPDEGVREQDVALGLDAFEQTVLHVVDHLPEGDR